ncbi:DUF268 domain-containing protein [bacterium]|nr:DUF268 domain-containing protein [bacterium]
MKRIVHRILVGIGRQIFALGFDPRAILTLRHYPKYLRHKREWKSKGGKITQNYMILGDYEDSAGKASGHYFHQDLLVASFIAGKNPKRHVDIGSRVDGFVAHVASFRKIEVVDIRPLPPSKHANIHYVQADLMNPSQLGKTDSLSCLHAIEHFGLGRYTDPIDVDGHIKGIANLVALVESGGTLYISFPIGQGDEVHFNAHRVFHPKTILTVPAIRDAMELKRFDYVDDAGDLHTDVSVDDAVGQTHTGCGIYTFIKK